MPKALASCTILVLGEFGHSPYQIREWIKYHGGTQVKGLNDSTTHIVCSEKNWKANHPTVLAAIKLDDAKTNANSKSKGSSKGSKKLNIVTWDWLEDCMIKRRNFAAKKYEWRAPVQKASRLEELIKQWGEMTGVEMSARLVYGAGGKTVNVNATVKGKAKAKGKGNEKSKGKALSPVEQELAKAKYSIHHTDSTVYDVVLILPGATKDRYRISLYHNAVTSKPKKSAITTTINVYAGTMTFSRTSTSAKTTKTTFLADAEPGSDWDAAYEAFAGFLKAKTDLGLEKLMHGVEGEVVNGWTVLNSGDGGSVVQWVRVGSDGTGANVPAVGHDQSVDLDEAAADETNSQDLQEEGHNSGNMSDTGSIQDFIDDSPTDDDETATDERNEHDAEEETANSGSLFKTRSTQGFNDEDSTSALLSDCKAQQGEEIERNNPPITGVPVKYREDINQDTSLIEDDAQSSVLSSIPDDAFEIEEQNKESDDDDDIPLRRTRARTIASKKDVLALTATHDDAATVAAEDEDEDSIPRLRKRARRVPASKKVAAKTARQAADTATSEDEDQGQDESESEIESKDGGESDYQEKDDMSSSRKRIRKGVAQKKGAAKKQKV